MLNPVQESTHNSSVSILFVSDWWSWYGARENRFIHNHGIDLQAKPRCDLIPGVGVSLVSFFKVWLEPPIWDSICTDYFLELTHLFLITVHSGLDCRFLSFFSLLDAILDYLSMLRIYTHTHTHRQLNQKEHRMPPFLSRTSLFRFLSFCVLLRLSLTRSYAPVVFLRDRFRSSTCKTE